MRITPNMTTTLKRNITSIRKATTLILTTSTQTKQTKGLRMLHIQTTHIKEITTRMTIITMMTIKRKKVGTMPNILRKPINNNTQGITTKGRNTKTTTLRIKRSNIRRSSSILKSTPRISTLKISTPRNNTLRSIIRSTRRNIPKSVPELTIGLKDLKK
jgi:hypothetical protein